MPPLSDQLAPKYPLIAISPSIKQDTYVLASNPYDFALILFYIY